MWFAMVGRMGPGMRQARFGVQSMAMGNFGGKCGSPHCNHGEFAAPSQITLRFLVSIIPNILNYLEFDIEGLISQSTPTYHFGGVLPSQFLGQYREIT